MFVQCRDSGFQCCDSALLSLLESCFDVATLHVVAEFQCHDSDLSIMKPSANVATLVT